MEGSLCSYSMIRRMETMHMIKLRALLCDLLKFLLMKIRRHSVDDQQSEEDSTVHQLEVLNCEFEAATTSNSDPTWLRFSQVPVVPMVIDTESIKKQLPVVQYRELKLKKRSSQLQLQAASPSSPSSSEEKMHTSSCIVCMNSIEGSDEVRELCNCEHVFHRDCLDAWIGQAQSTCPLCRSELLVPATASAITLKHDKDGGGGDPWRAERMIYLFGEDIFFTS